MTDEQKNLLADDINNSRREEDTIPTQEEILDQVRTIFGSGRVEGGYARQVYAATVKASENTRPVSVKVRGDALQMYIVGENAYTLEMLRSEQANRQAGLKTVYYLGELTLETGEPIFGYANPEDGTSYVQVDAKDNKSTRPIGRKKNPCASYRKEQSVNQRCRNRNAAIWLCTFTLSE